ncbi:hypothetical protein HPB51_029120 [Rhipicephalus microplus]|uniref:RING-type domain-containing protein n=1 Tax=Rhipicephalus microplus TaxID=6941 RepID=A0A9J6CVJ2_RHIMP|nr:hypothetical protein HPB51_029120 [Rhipicephalus microplus]
MSTFRRRLRREDPEMAVREYTLTGFSDFLDRRRVGFVEELPPNRVCAVCGMVPSRSLILPCGHTLCRLCRSQITEQNGCPLDGRQFADADLLPVVFSEADLEQHRVLCIAGGQKCRFSGKLRDMRRHLAECVGGGVLCGKCRRSVDRSGAVAPYKRCRREFYASPQTANDVANRVNTSLDRISCIQSNVSREADVKDGACSGDWEGASAGSTTKPPVAPGPYRAPAKPGVYIETCRFVDVYSAYNAMKQGDVKRSMLTGTYTLAGYTFKLACELFKNEKKEVCTRFAFILRHGDWDDHVDWPFRKKVTLTIAHPRYEDKDIGMPISVDDYAAAKKPVPAIPNSSSWTGELYWKDIDEHGYIGNKALYVNVQFE